MAVKKKAVKKSPAKPRAKSLSAAKKAVTKRKKRGPKKKGMLSELFSPATAKGAASAMISGAIGGGAVRTIDKLMPPSWGLQGRILGTGAVAFITASILQMPNVAAGMTGALAFQVLEKKLLAEEEEFEDTEFTDEQVMAEMPEFLSDDGQILLQDQNGKLQYLADMQPQYYAPYNRQY